MNTHADQTQENKSQAVSAVNSQMQSGGKSTFQFFDNRPEAVAKRKLQEMANNSPIAMQLKAFQDMANDSPQAKQVAQLQAMSDNHSAQQQPIQKKANKTGLPDNLKTGMENLSGMSLDDVKVHRNSDKPVQLQAHAYAQGTDIHLEPGQEKHLPHEAWHVVQQKQGRVKPTKQLKSKVNINDDAGLEKEADIMGAKSLQMKVNADSIPTCNSQSTTANTVQRVTYNEAKTAVGATMEANLAAWVKAKSGSDVEGEWDTFLEHMTGGDVKGRLNDYNNQGGLTEAVSSYKDYNALKVMTLSAMHYYAEEQVDWHASDSISATERKTVREMLMFGRAGNLGPCGGMTIENLKAQADIVGDESEFFEKIGIYSRSVSQSTPIKIARTSDVDKAIKIGSNLKKLNDSFGATILKGAMPETEFNLIIQVDKTDDLVDYYTNVNPTPLFQSKNGRDFRGYTQMQVLDNADPKTYDAGDLSIAIRNYHRFTKATLDKLRANYADTSKAKPLTLILHTAIDHNGAFVRDPKLEAVVTNGNIHAIMIEGKETLDSVKSEIQPLAAKYGKNNKLDQVMIAGHGGAQSIELAGKLQNGGELNAKEELIEDSNAVDLVNDKAKAQELFDEILDNMDIKPTLGQRFGSIFGPDLPARQAHRRIMFNACLTNSNYIGDNLNQASVGDVRKAIRKYIENHANLVSFAESRAKAKDSNEVTVRGSNASHGRLDMLDAQDSLDLISASDPKLTAPKLEYAEHGTEPTGALRAVLECWASDKNSERDNLKAAMRRRIAKNSTDWRDRVIETLYDMIIRYAWEDGQIIKYMSLLAGEISHAQSETECKPRHFIYSKQLGVWTDALFKGMRAADHWSNRHYIPLVFYQIWIMIDKTVKPNKEFVDQLGTHFDCSTAEEFVDIPYIATKIPAMLASGGSDKGKLTLALLGVIKENQAACRKFLTDRLDDQDPPLSKDAFDPGDGVNALLNGLSTEDDILIKIGKKQAPVLDIGADIDLDRGPDTRTGNIKLEGDASNKHYIDSVTKKGKIKKDPNTKAYKKPDKGSGEAGELAKNAEVFIVGTNYDWWAIEYTYVGDRVGTAFIEKGDIELT
ncbi:eCIS core domain-containing protein [Desulfobacula phenolica]|uniref:eCIS core domain-containing protein n=1 Tax=Desulfobacula phenolica TaxID=90732 RepID=A0A1H2JQH1_9BACT|nr:DUF4157 domain-containing protein [Desulfobacula phenolica]SDU58396.1 protein of unknown function [Desulfobacula phenolica]